MKKRIENIKKQYGKEGKRLLFVWAGFITGRAFAAGMNMLAEKFPEQENWFKYGKAPVLGLSGWLICSASSPDAEFAKHFGYGIGASAALEGIKIIPIAKDYLGEVDSSFEKTYYREDDKPAISIGEFGIKSLPIRSVEMGEVEPIEIELPELDGASENLGYNKAATEDADMNGII